MKNLHWESSERRFSTIAGELHKRLSHNPRTTWTKWRSISAFFRFAPNRFETWRMRDFIRNIRTREMRRSSFVYFGFCIAYVFVMFHKNLWRKTADNIVKILRTFVTRAFYWAVNLNRRLNTAQRYDSNFYISVCWSISNCYRSIRQYYNNWWKCMDRWYNVIFIRIRVFIDMVKSIDPIWIQ